MQSLVCGNKVDNSVGCPFLSRMHVPLCRRWHIIYSCAGSAIYESGFYIRNWNEYLPPTTFGQHSYLTPSTQYQAATHQCSTGYNPVLCSCGRVVVTTKMFASDGAGEVANTGWLSKVGVQGWNSTGISAASKCSGGSRQYSYEHYGWVSSRADLSVIMVDFSKYVCALSAIYCLKGLEKSALLDQSNLYKLWSNCFKFYWGSKSHLRYFTS